MFLLHCICICSGEARCTKSCISEGSGCLVFPYSFERVVLLARRVVPFVCFGWHFWHFHTGGERFETTRNEGSTKKGITGLT